MYFFLQIHNIMYMYAYKGFISQNVIEGKLLGTL